MTARPMRLAWLVPVLGLSVPAWERAHAQEACDPRVPTEIAQAAAVVSSCIDPSRHAPGALSPEAIRETLAALGLDSGLPAAPGTVAAPSAVEPAERSARAVDAAGVPVHETPASASAALRSEAQTMQRAIWALGLDDGTPVELFEPGPARLPVAAQALHRPAAAAKQTTPTAPEVLAAEAAARSVDLPLTEAPEVTEATGTLVARAPLPFDLPHEPPTAPPPDVKTLAPRDPPAPRKHGEALHPVVDEPPPQADLFHALFGAMGNWFESAFASGAVAGAAITDPHIERIAATELPSVSAPVLMATGIAPLAVLAAEPADRAPAPSHTERVLLSLERVLAPDGDDRSAMGSRDTSASEADKVLATLATVKRETQELSLLKAQVAAAKRFDGDPTVCFDLPAPAGAEVAQSGRVVSEGVLAVIAGASPAIDADKLDRVRGGFSGENGLQISFGIERAVYVDGALVTKTALTVNNPGRVAGADLGKLNSLLSVQTGAGNTVVTGGTSGNAVGTVIQNSLDGQKIQNLTVINATVNSMQVMKGMQLQSTLTNALAASVRR